MANRNESITLARKLNGKKMVIPELWSIFGNWKNDLHPHYDKLRLELDKESQQ